MQQSGRPKCLNNGIMIYGKLKAWDTTTWECLKLFEQKGKTSGKRCRLPSRLSTALVLLISNELKNLSSDPLKAQMKEKHFAFYIWKKGNHQITNIKVLLILHH